MPKSVSSGNEIPKASTAEEVRDDIPARLSEGEFVLPADVVRYHGLEKLMNLRQEAKQGINTMDKMGQLGNADEATMPDDLPFDINDLEKMITEKTKIISVPHVSNVLGTIFPVKEISKLAHKVNAICVVDGCQGAIHLPVDVKDIGCDFYTFSSHKLYGPSGVGVLWGRSSILLEMPPFIGGGDMIDNVDIESSTYADPPHRFEAGTPPIAEVIAFGAAKDFEESISTKGITIFIDPAAVMFLVGSEMDWNESKFSSGFDFKNPNEIARCGCGESFSVSPTA